MSLLVPDGLRCETLLAIGDYILYVSLLLGFGHHGLNGLGTEIFKSNLKQHLCV